MTYSGCGLTNKVYIFFRREGYRPLSAGLFLVAGVENMTEMLNGAKEG